MALGSNKATGLSRDWDDTPVVALNHIGMDGLVCQVHQERTIRRTLDEPFDIVGEQVRRVPLGVDPFTVDIQ